jgi:hypothetical protein
LVEKADNENFYIKLDKMLLKEDEEEENAPGLNYK